MNCRAEQQRGSMGASAEAACSASLAFGHRQPGHEMHVDREVRWHQRPLAQGFFNGARKGRFKLPLKRFDGFSISCERIFAVEINTQGREALFLGIERNQNIGLDGSAELDGKPPAGRPTG